MTEVVCVMVTGPGEKHGAVVKSLMEHVGATAALVHVFDLTERPALRAAAIDIFGFEAIVRLAGEGTVMRVPSGCGHPQPPPTRAEIEETEDVITRVCPECHRPLWWHISEWMAL